MFINLLVMPCWVMKILMRIKGMSLFVCFSKGLWPFENDSIEHKREQAKRVISCALYMKKTFCDYMTSIGTILNIKSAIAMGSYSIIFLRVNLNLIIVFVCLFLLSNFRRGVRPFVRRFLTNRD